jgi:molybdopterin converting factor small subunit
VSWKLKRQSRYRKSREEKQREYIEQTAFELYQNRKLLGRPGDPQNDWQTAEKIVRSPWRTWLFATNRPFIKLEKHWIEPCSRWFEQSAIFDIVSRLSPALEAIGVLLIPLVLYFASQSYQNKQEAQELERLQQETVQNYIGQLSEILLSVEGDLRSAENQRIRTIATAATITLLRDPNLNGGRKGQVIEFLSQMNLVQQEADIVPLLPKDEGGVISFRGADLRDADLSDTDLSGAYLSDADLRDTDLGGAYLSDADLYGANLSGAYLIGAYLIGADLRDADLPLRQRCRPQRCLPLRCQPPRCQPPRCQRLNRDTTLPSLPLPYFLACKH